MEPAKIVVRYQDGTVLKGHTRDFAPEEPTFRLVPVAPAVWRRPVEVPLDRLKAVFFVRDFAGNPRYEERKSFADAPAGPGRRIEVHFQDGETLRGHTMTYEAGRQGFFLFPADPESNNLRVFAVAKAVRRVCWEGSDCPEPPRPVPAGPAASAGGPPMPHGEFLGTLGHMVKVLRQAVTDCEDVVAGVEALAHRHASLCQERERHEQEHRQLIAAHEQLARQHAEALRVADQLRRDQEAASGAVADLKAREAAASRHRHAVAVEIENILQRLQTRA